MILDDPARPRMNERPTYAGGRCVLPELSIWPERTQSHGIVCRISAMIIVGDNSFAWHHALVPADNITSVLLNYMEDPEATLYSLFGYHEPIFPRVSSKPVPRATVPALNIDTEDLLNL